MITVKSTQSIWIVSHVKKLAIFIVQLFLIILQPSKATFANENNLEGIRKAIDSYKHGDKYSLPLASHWNTDEFKKGPYGPTYQLKLLEDGEYLLPWTGIHFGESDPNNQDLKSFLVYLNKNKLPLSILSTQWESQLVDNQTFYLHKKTNLIDSNTISADGYVTDWSKVGELWAKTKLIGEMAVDLNNPQFIVFLSNNEQPKQEWSNLIDQAKILTGSKDNADWEEKRKQLGDKWINRYKSMIGSFRNNLPDSWKKNAVFVGYDTLGVSALGRWPGWIQYSLYTKDYAEPWHQVWDGSSSSYYLYDWNDMTDYKVMSPQIEAMNYQYLLNQATNINSRFWFELSIWDGYKAPGGGKRQYYKEQGQNWDKCRYKGYLGFGSWIMRPRVLREYRDYYDYSQVDYFTSILSFVRDVHENPILSQYWLNGVLVENTLSQIPYNDNLDNRSNKDRKWYLLNASSNKPYPWALTDKVSTYALALKLAEQNSYLVYSFSPSQSQDNVKINVPGYGVIDISATPVGSYYQIKGNVVQKINLNPNTLNCPS